MSRKHDKCVKGTSVGKHSSDEASKRGGLTELVKRRRDGRHAPGASSAAGVLRANRTGPVMAAIAIPAAACAALGVAGVINATPAQSTGGEAAVSESATVAPVDNSAAQKAKDTEAKRAASNEKASKAVKSNGSTLTTPTPTETATSSSDSTSTSSKSSKSSKSAGSGSSSSEKTYSKNTASSGQSGSCKASTYGDPQATASGETFNPSSLTAAHKSLPFNSMVKVTNKSNGKTVTVRINDRGPYVSGRCLDLSTAAMNKIGGDGVVSVTYKVL